MYEKVFQLDSRPFVSTPHIDRFYSARAAHVALSKACSTVDRASGTVVVVGPTGSGKTLFLNMIEDQFRSVYRVVNLACNRLAERQDLLQSILFELNQPYLNMSEGELRLALIDYLKPNVECPNGILLLVDDAHLLTPALFDEIRLLTNLVRDGQPRAQLVLAGSMRLEENLMDSNLESFNQRIAARCYLENFTASETEGYVHSAVSRAGGAGSNIFTHDGIEAVYEVTEGCPRLINQVCDHAMILAASTRTTSIDAACIHEAWADVQHMPNSWAEVATQSAQQREGSICEVEFGSLEEDDCQVEQLELGSTEPAVAFDEQPVDTTAGFSQEVVVEDSGEWNEIEFGQLNEQEAEQLASLPYDDGSVETSEVTYEIEQVVETTTVYSSDETLVVEQVEEYQLAPVEPVEEPVSMIDDFTELSELTENESTAEEQVVPSADDYVDVRFRDLAQFLANGGGLGSTTEDEHHREEPVVDDQDQADIQEELSYEVELSNTVVEAEPWEDDLDELALDAELNEIMQRSTPEIKVFHADDEAEANTENEASGQSWKDLFAEPFEQEELVYDPYTALVVEQNTQALSLTRVELSVLEDDHQETQDHTDLEAVEDDDLVDEVDEVDEFGVNEEMTQDEMDEVAEGCVVDEEPVVEGVDEQDLLDTIQKQQEEIADQIFQLKKDLAGTGVVEVDGFDDQGEPLPQGYENPVFDVEEAGMKLETPLESVNDDDRDILVITRVKQESRADKSVEEGVMGGETPVSKGRAIRMEYAQLFKQLRAAE